VPLLARDDVARVLTARLIPAPTRGAVVMVSGPGGIGKTTLLAACISDVAAAGVRVARTRAAEQDEHQPLAAIRSLLASVSPRAATDLDTVTNPAANPAAKTADAHAGAAQAVVNRVDAWCDTGPFLIWADDAHHLDASSVTVLARLARATRDLPLTILLSSRPALGRADLADLAALADEAVILEPLGPAELARLVAEHLGAPPGPRLAAALGPAGGNPFAATLFLDTLVRAGAINTRDGRADLADGAHGPASVTAAVTSRLSGLPASARDAAAALAVLGGPSSVTDLSAMLDRPLADVRAALVAADGVVGLDGDRAAFAHDLYPETLLAGLPAAEREGWHRAARRALERRAAPGAAVAGHALRGGQPDAPGLARAAAAAIAQSAPGVAADLLAAVVPLISPGDTDEVVLERAQNLFFGGREREAEDLIRSYLPRARSPRARIALSRLALVALHDRAQVTAVLAEIDNHLALGGLTGQDRAAAERLRAWALVNSGHLVAGERLTEEVAADASPSAGDAVVTSNRALIAYLHGRAADALAIHRAAAGQRDQRMAGPAFSPLFTLYARGPAAALEASHAERVISREHAARWVEPFHEFVLGNIHYDAGQWDDAVAALDTGLEVAQETGTGWIAVPWGCRALIDSHRAERELARARLDRLARLDLPAQLGMDYPRLAAMTVTEADAVTQAAGGTSWGAAMRPAVAAAEQLWAAAIAGGGELWILRAAQYACRLLPARDLLVPVTAAAQGQVPGLDPLADQLRAMADADEGLLRSAAEAFAAAGYPLGAALAWEQAGFADVTPEFAARALREAVAGFTRLGATGDLARLRTRARLQGLRTGRAPAVARPVTGWKALTPTEQTVSQLVGRGLTNPQIAAELFLSPRTVQTHVSHILQKTQLRSRVEIATARATS
jgi:DNA-binding CsgD family transcriptional regulator